MQLLHIDKQLYRQRTNIVIASFVASLAILSLIFGSLLIHFFGTAVATNDGSTGNFHWNLMGVILALVLCSGVLHSKKDSPYLHEVYYVWRLKQIHNQIYRKLAKIKNAADNHDKQAFIILSFYFASLKQVYSLDNNTLTLASVEQDLAQLNAKIAALELNVSPAQFTVALLDNI